LAAGAQQAQQEAAGHSVLVMGVATDGRVWQWQLPLLTGTLRDPKLTAAAAAVPAASAAVPPQAPKPELLGLLHTLPHRITTFSVCPAPVALPGAAGGAAIAAVAAATAAGSIEIVVVQQGALLPLHLSISASLAAHSSAIQVGGAGQHWLAKWPAVLSDGFPAFLLACLPAVAPLAGLHRPPRVTQQRKGGPGLQKRAADHR
jgi:hypothetical protein